MAKKEKNKVRVNITNPETGKTRVGSYDEKSHLITVSNGKKLKPKNVKINTVFNE